MSENRATKRLEYCDMEERSLFKRSRTQEEAEGDKDSPATKRRDVQPQPQPGPSSELLQSGLGSSYSSGEGSVNNMFDVFISHRGPDTKCSLAYPFYFLLQERGVEAFLDREELQSGERFPEAIEKAIACSKVDVCILSSGFAESEWCLKELLMMLHKYDMGTSTLIPIFYDVKPAEVKYVRGAFGQGFENLQSKNRNSSEDIEQWRRALGKIGEISGYEGKGELCRIIVNKICELLDVGSIATFQKVLGIEKQLLSSLCDIMRCRENGRGVTLVEISGIGGIGKTTFAKELYNKICYEFERCCFIEDINGLTEKHGINEVHKELLKKLFGQDSSSFRMEGKKHLMKKLHEAEILVVFDNIHSKIPLSKVFVEDSVSLSERSIIIVTSREEGVLKHDPEVKEYCKNLIPLKIKTLDFNTSKRIFCHCAFGRIDDRQNEFNELIEKMVKKCDGLPLALTLLGRHVYNKEIKFWENLLCFMEDSLYSEVKDKLKFSYDNLGTEMEKCLFLDVATFFRGEKESSLVHVRQRNEEDGKSIQYALDMLKSNLLIHVSFNGVLHMHDVLVDLGRSIVKDENLCPGHRSRVWYPSDVRLMLSRELGTEKVKALSLVSGGSAILHEDQCPWSADVFNKLSSLEILILHGHCIQGDFSKLSKRLLWLRWTNFPYLEIPLKLCIKHLRVLQVTSENMIWLPEHPPQEAPSELRELNFRHCIKLERLPESIGMFRHLSSINLDECKSLKFIPESFGQLQELKEFQLQGCHALEGLPKTFGELRSLSSLRMEGCTALKQLPKTFGELRSLTSFTMEDCIALKQLPETFGELRSLTSFKMEGCTTLKQLSETFGELKSLSSLRMEGCRALKQLPETFGKLRSLTSFTMEGCKKLKQLPETFGELRSLTSFRMEGCRALKQLPETFGELRSLTSFRMEGCTALKQLPETFGELKSLTSFKMEGCRALKQLPETFGELRSLTSFRMEGCTTLKQLPETFGELRSLTSFRMEGCTALKQLPETFGELRSLTSLRMKDCIYLKQLPETFGELRSLTFFRMEGCRALKQLPKTFGELKSLTSFRIECCRALKQLPETFGELRSLTSFRMKGCRALKQLPETFRELKSLTFFRMEGCTALKQLPEFFEELRRELRSLTSFRLEGCTALETFGELRS